MLAESSAGLPQGEDELERLGVAVKPQLGLSRLQIPEQGQIEIRARGFGRELVQGLVLRHVR